MERKKILITGASGFIGSTVVDKALQLGFDVWAGVRANSSKSFLQNKSIRFIQLNFADKNALKEQLHTFIAENGTFDYIVHCAGITKAVHKSQFDAVNFEQVKTFVDTLTVLHATPRLFVFLSTLGAMGVGDEKNYTPIPCNCKPNPNTAYGKSKLKAENFLKSIPGFPYIILRPTGVYGPRDKDYLILMRAVKNGLSVGAGFRKQILTFIHVDDLTNVIFSCIERGVSRREYNVADGDIYTDSQFNRLVQQAFQKKRVVRLKVPLFLVKPAAFVSEKLAALFGRATTFNSDKYKIMKQRNWACDISPLQEELKFKANYSLKEGIEKTIEWYKQEGWL